MSTLGDQTDILPEVDELADLTERKDINEISDSVRIGLRKDEA